VTMDYCILRRLVTHTFSVDVDDAASIYCTGTVLLYICVGVFMSVLLCICNIDGQDVLVCLVHLQTDNFRLFLCKQMDKRKISVHTMSKQ
jgi:hypothetical protein